MCLCLWDICLIVLSVFFPPLPVWICRGICSYDSLINILLMFLGYFPGLIHSWYIIAKYPPYYNHEESRVYFVYRSDLENQTPAEPGRGPRCTRPHRDENTRSIAQEPQSQPSFNYGAVGEGGSGSGTSNINDGASRQVFGPPAYSELDNKQSQ
ncbi:hypothetical protein KGF56_004020 [Candida oxycetoniae]|uniref:Stress response RCI peptide n=1 Tax=Candida oxycetoniae TaxID=497107 RepID=A0AAI9SUH5_9ASCO|nr:uncharacterized protein KGF56_004020 [Candida oxycetoniae]KAI3403131.2 hypothetical protein KGF56_004020 [Candida oxycetoniae]